MNHIDTMKQALEALESLYLPGELERVNAAITRMRKTISEAEQPQPVRREQQMFMDEQEFYTAPPQRHPLTEEQYLQALGSLRDEVVCSAGTLRRVVCAIEAAVNQQPPRQPLTDEFLRKLHHIDEFGLFCDYDDFEQISRAIEDAHGIKEQP